jgi:hypothetical protein
MARSFPMFGMLEHGFTMCLYLMHTGIESRKEKEKAAAVEKRLRKDFLYLTGNS